MEYARIRKEESEMNLTQEDLERMGLTRKGKWQYTVADIEALPEEVRVELIDGELFIMEAPEFDHQDILMGLSFQIELYIQRKKGKCRVVPAPFGVYIKKDIHNYVMPDISLICDEGKLERKGCKGAPDLVIEIVSPSSRKMDYIRKLALYQESGVREYWIVDPKSAQVTIYGPEHGDMPVQRSFSERIKVGVYDDLYLDLANLHGTLDEVLTEERQAAIQEGMQEGVEEGIQQGIQQGLAALINSLKAVLPDLDAVCKAVTQNEIYKDISRDEIARHYGSKH